MVVRFEEGDRILGISWFDEGIKDVDILFNGGR
jgi:hypothetical protein